MAEASINGTCLFYETSGDGPPCIVLHGGLGLDHTYMRELFGPLKHLGRFVYVDQRGNGRSDRPPLETITMQQLAADVEALRAHLGLQRVGITGHSFGGFVALEYATTHPDRVSHLLLIDTAPGVFEPTPEEMAERGDDSWITPAVHEGLAVIAGGPPADDESFAAMLPKIAPAYVRTVDPAVVAASLGGAILDAKAGARGFEALDGWSVADDLGVIACPTLVVCGRYDLFATPECAKRLSTAIPGADLAWFEHSGHFPWLEEPDAFYATVGDWLRRV